MAGEEIGRSTGAGELILELPVDPRPRVDVGPPFRRFNSGWLALDFVNTVPGWLGAGDVSGRRDWRDQPAGERLPAYPELLQWARLQHLLGPREARMLATSAAAHPRRAAAVMVRAHALRAALYRLYRASAQGWSPRAEDVAIVDAEQALLRDRERLLPRAAGAVLAWVSAAADPEALVWPVVRSAVTLLTSPELMARVGQCGGPECGWVFLDVGRGRSRRWCDARDCGNVAKARAFRRRHRAHG